MIPARYSASRFPGKLMQNLAGKSVILRTYEATVATKLFSEVYVVTDSDIIYNEIINKASGKVMKIESWGFLNFARKINNYNKGFYIHYKFEGTSKTLDEIKKNILIDESILRHLTIRYKKLDMDKEYFKKEDLNDEKKK